MDKFRFKLSHAGVRQLLKSEAMQNGLHDTGWRIAKRCGEGYSADDYKGKNRVNTAVWATTPEARRDNMKNNTILKNLKG